jgi:hypothetical protein
MVGTVAFILESEFLTGRHYSKRFVAACALFACSNDARLQSDGG